MEHAGKVRHWLHASMKIQVVLAKSCAYLLLKQQHNFYCCCSPICMFFFPSSQHPVCVTVHNVYQASWLSGIFCLVYYLSLDCGIEFPSAVAAAAAAGSQGGAWLAFEMKQTEQRRLFIRSEQIIVEKVTAATVCWRAQEDVEGGALMMSPGEDSV